MSEIETRVVFDEDNFLAIDLNPSSCMFNCVIFKNSDNGRWIVKRRALPMEIARAKRRLEELECATGVPQKGW